MAAFRISGPVCPTRMLFVLLARNSTDLSRIRMETLTNVKNTKLLRPDGPEHGRHRTSRKQGCSARRNSRPQALTAGDRVHAGQLDDKPTCLYVTSVCDYSSLRSARGQLGPCVTCGIADGGGEQPRPTEPTRFKSMTPSFTRLATLGRLIFVIPGSFSNSVSRRSSLFRCCCEAIVAAGSEHASAGRFQDKPVLLRTSTSNV